VMAVHKLHLEEPTTVNLSLHTMRSSIPVVEISDQDNGCCGRRGAIEVDGLGGVSRPITIDTKCGMSVGVIRRDVRGCEFPAALGGSDGNGNVLHNLRF